MISVSFGGYEAVVMEAVEAIGVCIWERGKCWAEICGAILVCGFQVIFDKIQDGGHMYILCFTYHSIIVVYSCGKYNYAMCCTCRHQVDSLQINQCHNAALEVNGGL